MALLVSFLVVLAALCMGIGIKGLVLTIDLDEPKMSPIWIGYTVTHTSGPWDFDIIYRSRSPQNRGLPPINLTLLVTYTRDHSLAVL